MEKNLVEVDPRLFLHVVYCIWTSGVSRQRKSWWRTLRIGSMSSSKPFIIESLHVLVFLFQVFRTSLFSSQFLDLCFSSKTLMFIPATFYLIIIKFNFCLQLSCLRRIMKKTSVINVISLKFSPSIASIT